MRNLLPVFALLFCVTSLQSQATQPVVGQRVWVRSSNSTGHLDKGVKGTFEAISGDSLQLRLLDGGEVVSIGLADQTELFVFAGRRGAPLRGAVIGGGGGALLGLFLGLAGGEDCSGSSGLFSWCFSRGGMAAIGAVGLGTAGLVGGLIVGAVLHHDTWVRVGGSGALRPVITPKAHGLGLGLSLSF
jgi:hypothetical protein